VKDKNISDWIDLLSVNVTDAEIELPVLSGSMDPFLPAGKMAVIRKISRNEIGKLKAGTIIVYRKGYNFTAHRMLLRFPFINYIYEKGDRNRFGSFIKYDAVSGIVCSVKDKNGIIFNFLSEKEIKIAKRESRKNILIIIFNTVLILPRRVKGVLEKK